MTNIIPLTNIINVSITQTPSGLTEQNVNSFALFTNETPSNVDSYRVYVTASQVAEDYGTSSVTAAMANAMFAQTPNLRSGNGVLNIVPMQAAVSATAGDFTTSDISGNLSNFQAVDDGDISVDLNGTVKDLTGLDFTNASDLDDIAQIIQAKIKDAIVAVDGNTIVVTSKKAGALSSATLQATAGGAGTDLSAAGLLDVLNGTDTAGTNSSGETVEQAIARIEDELSFVGFMTNLNLEDDAVTSISTAVQATDRIFLHHFASTEDIAGIATTISGAGNTKTRPLLYTESLSAANLMKAAYAGRAFSVNTRGADTAQTMHLKQLATITPDPLINQTDYTQALAAGIDFYSSIAGVPSVISTGGNDFFDNVYSDLALKFALETSGFNHLRQTNTKVPQTEEGMNGLKSAYSQVLRRFVNNGYVAPGSWTSSETFGNPEVFKENILQKGFYVFSNPITQQPAADREARKAPLVQIAVKRAGAIHSSDVIVVIND